MTDSIAVKVLILGTFSFSVVYILATAAINGIIDGYNLILVTGLSSADTFNDLNIAVNIWKFAPIAFLCGLILWMFERAKGTNISAGLFYIYESVLVLSIFYSLIWIVCYGTVLDMILNVIMLNPNFIPTYEHWDVSVHVFRLARVVYMLIIAPAYLGTILFAIHPVIVQTDTLIYGEDGKGGDEFVTNFEQI
jgi:hypothetical protein